MLGEKPGTLLQLRLRPFSPRSPLQTLLFPGKSLFSVARRFYRCCQERRSCGSVRGIPGRLTGGKNKQKKILKKRLVDAFSQCQISAV